MKRGYRYIEDVPDATVRLGLALGLMREAPDEPGVMELTPKGSEWLDKYLDQELKIARMMAL